MKTGKRIPLVVDSKFKSHIGTVDSKNLKSADLWILSRLSRVKQETAIMKKI